jgi:hypothetical protein
MYNNNNIEIEIEIINNKRKAGALTCGAAAVLVGEAGAAVGPEVRARHALGVIAPPAHRLLGTVRAFREVGAVLICAHAHARTHTRTHTHTRTRTRTHTHAHTRVSTRAFGEVARRAGLP